MHISTLSHRFVNEKVSNNRKKKNRPFSVFHTTYLNIYGQKRPIGIVHYMLCGAPKILTHYHSRPTNRMANEKKKKEPSADRESGTQMKCCIAKYQWHGEQMRMCSVLSLLCRKKLAMKLKMKIYVDSQVHMHCEGSFLFERGGMKFVLSFDSLVFFFLCIRALLLSSALRSVWYMVYVVLVLFRCWAFTLFLVTLEKFPSFQLLSRCTPISDQSHVQITFALCAACDFQITKSHKIRHLILIFGVVDLVLLFTLYFLHFMSGRAQEKHVDLWKTPFFDS